MSNINSIKRQLKQKATNIHKHIYPIQKLYSTSSWAQCYTIEGDTVYFWFNTKLESGGYTTRILKSNIY